MTVRLFAKPVEDFQKGPNHSLDLTVDRCGSEDYVFHAAGQSCRYVPWMYVICELCSPSV
ncbi:MAG: hypothetical protein AB4040_17200 [Synechococcus sp.]